MKKVISTFLALLFVVLTAFTVSAESNDITGANWMSAVDGSLPITAINMPGSHDSTTQYVSASIVSRTQGTSVLQQLYNGARYFDMRLKISGNKIIDVHGISNCKTAYGLFAKDLLAADVVAQCEDFLSKNPGETILFLMKDSDEEKGTGFYSKFYDDIILKNPEYWFLENRIPTLDEVRGKIVLLRCAEIDKTRFDDSNGGINFENYPRITSMKIDEFKLCPITKANGERITDMFVQDSFRVEGKRKKATIENFFNSDLSKSNFNICCTNAVLLRIPYANAKDINSFLMSYNFESGKYYGIVLNDYVTPELCEKIYMTNSNEMINAPRAASETPEFFKSYSYFGVFLEEIRDWIVAVLCVGI